MPNNLHVHLFKPRQDENDKKDFKFLNPNELFNIDKWLGSDSDDKSISKGNEVIYRIKYHNIFNNYEEEKYKLLKWENQLEIIVNLLRIEYHKLYLDVNDWYTDKPEVDNDMYFTRDPLFAQRVKIEDPNSRIFIIGDIHSSIHSLIDIFNQMRVNGFFKNNGGNRDQFKMNDNCYLFFLGDIIDRGPYSIEALTFVLILKIQNFDRVHIVNGNHEDYELYKDYGFLKETENQFGMHPDKLKKLLFFLPSLILLDFNNETYHLCHGAISDKEDEVDKIKDWKDSEKKFLLLNAHDPKSQLKWGDFKTSYGFHSPLNGRAVFGLNIIKDYCDSLGITTLITGHQDLKPFLCIPRYLDGIIDSNRININNRLFYLHKNKNELYADDSDEDEVRGKDNDESSSDEGDDLNVFLDDFLINIENDKKLYEKFDCSTTDDYNPLYDLYAPCKKEDFTLPTTEILVVTTSTAVISKDLRYNCYLELNILSN